MHILIALVAIVILGVGATIAGVNYYAPESLDVFKSTGNTTDLNSSIDLNNVSDLNFENSFEENSVTTSTQQIDLNGASDCTVIFANNPNEILRTVGLGFCEVESMANNAVAMVGVNPMHIWFGLLILAIIFLLVSYGMTILSSKATWILLAGMVLVAVLFFFRVI